MSDEEKKPPKRKWFRRLVPRTVAGKTAVVTALVLVTTLVVVWSLRIFGPESVRLRHAMTASRMAVELALTAAIPWALYLGLSRWNQVIEGVYPDVDRAWQAGIDALESQGVDVSEYPLFVILGSADTESESGLMEALDSKLRVQAIPSEPGVSQPLQWYLTEDAIYLFCPGASALSGLMGRWTTPDSSPATEGRPLPARQAATRSVATPTRSSSTSKPASGSSQTSHSEPVTAPSAPEPTPSAPTPSAPAPDHFMGTLQSGALTSPAARPGPVTPAATSSPPAKAVDAAPGAEVKSVTSA
ncbi:MAG: hypothetical protein AAFV88_21325, partial [Planctomycetota bacterium]